MEKCVGETWEKNKLERIVFVYNIFFNLNRSNVEHY